MRYRNQFEDVDAMQDFGDRCPIVRCQKKRRPRTGRMTAGRLAAVVLLSGIGLVQCVQPVGVWARDIYVNNVAGDDHRDGSSADTTGKAGGPVRSISCALKLATKGDRIILSDTGQPYRESVTLQAGRHSGVAGRPFTIVGNGAVLDGTRPIPADVWRHVRNDVFRFRPPRMAYQLLYLDGKPAARVAPGPGGGLPDLKPLQWCLLDRRVYFRTEPGLDPASYDLSHTALPVGITVYEARHVLIRRLTVQGFQLDGVNAHDGAFDLTLAGLVCRGNGRSGVSVGGASRVVVESCLVGNNGAAQLRTEGYSRTRVVNSDLIDDPLAPAVIREGGEVIIEKPAKAIGPAANEPAANGPAANGPAATKGGPAGGE